MSSPTCLRSRSLWSNNKWQLAKPPPQKTRLCISRSYYLCLHRSVCKITLSHLVQSRWGFCKPFVVHLLVHLRSASSTAVSANQSLRQTDAGRRMIRCCLTSAQCGTCVFGVGLIARFWTRSRSAEHRGPQSCSGLCLFAHYRVIKIGSVTLRCVAFLHMCTVVLRDFGADQSRRLPSMVYWTWRSLNRFYGVLQSWSVAAWMALIGC